jgi:hypothetical protein
MKKQIAIFLLSFCATQFAFAQQKVKVKHMIITIVENPNSINIGHSPNVFITRDDTAQVRQYVNFNQHVKLRDIAAAHEAQLMEMFKPYYDDGWKLVTTSIGEVPSVSNSVEQTSRYFFIKED